MVGIVGVAVSTGYFVREANILLDMSPAQIIERQVAGRSCTLKCSKSCGRYCTKRSQHLISDIGCSPQNREAILEYYRSIDSFCRNSARYEYRLAVPHWEKGHDYYTFEPSAEVYDRSPRRATLQIPLHPGALNIKWGDIDSIRPQ